MAKADKPKKTGFRGPSPDVGKATQFKKGEIHNPNGRPVTKPFKREMERLFAENPELFPKIVKQLVAQAASGEQSAIKEIRDMTDGKPRQEISGPDGGPVPVDLAGAQAALADLVDELKKQQE